MAGPVLPAYGRSTLAELLPGVAAQLNRGAPAGADASAALDLPRADRYVVLLVDGLGWAQLEPEIGWPRPDAPYLAGLAERSLRLTSGVPSTTATSLSSLGTGLPPGQHGVVGYSCRIPQTGEILNTLLWESDLVPEELQPHPTWFERLTATGVAVTAVSLSRFSGSGLTRAGLRGPVFQGYADEWDEDHRVELTVAAAQRGDRSLVYAYERQLDHVGHVQGWRSLGWRQHLVRVDALCERLRAELPDDVRLLITGDHGMVDVPRTHRVIAEDEPELMAGVSALAGEGRFRQLYVDRDDPAAVAERWRQHLGDRAWVRLRGEAIAEGWFGPVADEVVGRYGDVLVALRSDWAVMTRQWPRELELVGMHGSLTAAEMQVPLLVD